VRHRRDIDGLRAVAVGSVVLCHAGVRGVAGGFVGVDIFFVISGYLITSLSVGEIAQGQFSLVRFTSAACAEFFRRCLRCAASEHA
jgi:peptidoglycan/LPS O-acetylase OafA/YrhL